MSEALRDFFTRDDADLDGADDWPQAHNDLLQALESGSIRAAERDGQGRWNAVAWVKRAILLGFRRSEVVPMPNDPMPAFFDKQAFPVRSFEARDMVRLVPGGSAVRRGAYVAAGVVMMPPAYVNVGAFVDEGTMVDSHALVGSCAQVGKHVHLSAGAQLGGVLEPINQSPVVIENDVFVGALAGVFEGFVVRERAVLAAGVILTAQSVVYDLVNGTEHRHEVPAGAVVVPGSRPARGGYAESQGLQLAAPVIVKYRDARTDASTALEDALR